MTPDQFPFRDLTTAAGIAAAALLIRQIIEAAKHSFLPWLDANNERKGTFILAALLYVAWLAVYGTDLATDGPAALAAFWTTSIAAMGTNESIDAAKAVVAKSVVQTVADDPVVATAATASGVINGGSGSTAKAGGAVVADADASIDDDAFEASDSGAPLEPGPDLDLNVNNGNPLDDDEDEGDQEVEEGDLLDPAAPGSV